MKTFYKPSYKPSARLLAISLASGLIFSAATVFAKTPTEDIEWMEEMIDIDILVQMYDKNSDKLLSAGEITQGSQYEIQRSDANRDGKISLSEFEPVWNSDMQQYARAEFAKADLNRSQDITLDEIVENYRMMEKKWLASACVSPLSSEAELRLDASQELTFLDDNSDKRLSYAEFSRTERREMIAEFQELDRNGDGQLTAQELQLSLQELAKDAAMIKQELAAAC